jgi:protocatechuate 3,4-dioxygenase beta subunit
VKGITPLETGEEREIDIEFERGASIHGTVRINGEVASIQIGVKSEKGWDEVTSNDRGSYLARGLPSGEIALHPQPVEGARTWRADPEHVNLLWLEKGQDLEHDIEIGLASETISGRVRDRGGRPVAGATVAIWNQSGRGGGGSSLEAKTNAEGDFEIGVPAKPGVLYRLLARSGPRRAVIDEVPGGARGLEIVLAEVGELALRVVDAETRKPIQRFSLEWRENSAGGYQLLSQGGRALSPGPDGIFLAQLPLGAVDLLVGARSQGYSQLEVVGCQVVEKKPPSVVEVLLHRGARVELTFLPAASSDETSPPRSLRRSRIWFATDEEIARGLDSSYQLRRARQIRLDGKGRATFEAIAPGRYRFRRVPDDLELLPAEFDVPATDRASYEVRWNVSQ